MTEDFLHYAWRTQNFNHDQLTTTTGSPVRIIKYGYWNKDSGPDFLDAKIQIGSQLWAGHVEIHVHEKEWFSHKHQNDPAYDSTILHVCYKPSAPARRTDKSEVPCLLLSDRINENTYLSYRRLMEAPGELPCSKLHKQIPDMQKSLWIERMHMERLEEHASRVKILAESSKNDWRDLLYKKLVGSFGLRVNREAFEMLANQIDLKIILQNISSLRNLEALFFGVAGFLEKPLMDTYSRNLQKDFEFLRHKYRLTPLPEHIWKFMRLRPAAFPTIRISQLASFFHRQPDFFSAFQDCSELKDMRVVLDCTAHNYWDSHYRFGLQSKRSSQKHVGESLKNRILINAVIPTLFAFYKSQQLEAKAADTADLLYEIPLENNKVTREFQSMGFPIYNAADGQACLHLKRNYCNFKACLKCSIGHSILNK